MEKKPLHVLFLTPYYHQNRGNTTTAKRLKAGMEKKNVLFDIYAYEEEPYTEQICKQIISADIVHILHFIRFSTWLKEHPLPLGNNVILTSGGTDVNEHLADIDDSDDIGKLFHLARRLTVFTKAAYDTFSDRFPYLKNKLEVIPQSAWLPLAPQRLKTARRKEGTPHFLLPAGLRKVKDVFYLIPALKMLKSSFPDLSFSVIGTAINPIILQQLEKLMDQYHWIDYLGEVPLEDMAFMYEQADIVLNTSISEGQPQTVLEAMLSHRPVFARKNAGNESIIEDGVNGYLFTSPEEFLEKARHFLLHQATLRKKIIKNAFTHVHSHFSLDKEIGRYLNIYQSIVSYEEN